MEFVFVTVDRAGRQAVHWRGLTEDLNDVDEINATLARLAADGEHVVRIQLWLPSHETDPDDALDVPVERFVGSPPSKQRAMLSMSRSSKKPSRPRNWS